MSDTSTYLWKKKSFRWCINWNTIVVDIATKGKFENLVKVAEGLFTFNSNQKINEEVHIRFVEKDFLQFLIWKFLN